MRLISTQFSLKTNSLDVYFGGCKGPHCINCHNPETHDMNSGEVISPEELFFKVRDKVLQFPALIKNVMLFGGEPLDQPHEELQQFLGYISNLTAFGKANIDVWLFTHYDLEEVPFNIRIKCKYIKTGRYLEEYVGKSEQYGIQLSTTNQKILKRGCDY